MSLNFYSRSIYGFRLLFCDKWRPKYLRFLGSILEFYWRWSWSSRSNKKEKISSWMNPFFASVLFTTTGLSYVTFAWNSSLFLTSRSLKKDLKSHESKVTKIMTSQKCEKTRVLLLFYALDKGQGNLAKFKIAVASSARMFQFSGVRL